MRDGRWARARLSSWPMLLALTVIAIAIQLSGVPNHDVAWILTSAGRLLDGGRFGRDIVDVNPPLAWWLLTVPVALADGGGWPRYPVFVACVAALTLASVRLTEVTLRHGGDGAGGRGVVLAAAAVMLFAPGYDYGQREHLLLITAVPYCMAAAAASRARPIPPGLSLAVGLFAAIGFCLKPYFLIIPAALAVWVSLRNRKLLACLRVETLVLGGVGCLYGAAVMLWAPAYLGSVVPEAVAGYWAYDESAARLWRGALSTLLPMGCALAVLIRAHRGRPMPLAAQAMIVAFMAAGAAALLQHKGWYYHFLPALGFGVVGCVALFRPRGGPVPMAALGLALIAGFGAATAYPTLARTANGMVTHVDALAALFAEKARGGTVFAFTTSPRDIHPALLLAGVGWDADACCMQQLPALVRAGEQAAGRRADQARAAGLRQLATVLHRLNDRPPVLILVDERPNKPGFGETAFDYLRFLAAQPGYPALFARYRPAGVVAGFRVFERAE